MRNKILTIISVCILFIQCKKAPENLPPSQKLLTLADSLSKSSYEKGYMKDKAGVIFKIKGLGDSEYNMLMKVASTQDLVYLTDYKEPKIRCYAFKGLVSKRYPGIKSIFFKHLKDTSLVTIASQCHIDEYTVMHFMYEHMFGFGKKGLNNKGLNNEEQNKVINIIIAERKARFAKNKSSR